MHALATWVRRLYCRRRHVLYSMFYKLSFFPFYFMPLPHEQFHRLPVFHSWESLKFENGIFKYRTFLGKFQIFPTIAHRCRYIPNSYKTNLGVVCRKFSNHIEFPPFSSTQWAFSKNGEIDAGDATETSRASVAFLPALAEGRRRDFPGLPNLETTDVSAAHQPERVPIVSKVVLSSPIRDFFFIRNNNDQEESE